MILSLIPYHDPRLRQPVRRVDDTSAVAELAENLRQTLVSFPTALGLAAPQVGEMVAMFVLKTGETHVSVIVNPEVVWMSEDLVPLDEGCLSLPGTSVRVVRPRKVKVIYQDELGGNHDELLDGMLARVFQHEFSHLQGRLIIDHVSPEEREKILQAQARRIKRTEKRSRCSAD